MTVNWKAVAVLITAIMVIPVCFVDSSDAADAADTNVSSFTITDGTGRTFSFDGASERLVTPGKGTTLTVAELGCLNKVVAVDNWSMPENANDERLTVPEYNPVSIGSLFYSDNNGYAAGVLSQLVDQGRLSCDDAIILTAYTNTLVLRDLLEKTGFTKVLVWTTIEDYDSIVDFVRAVSLIATGTLNTDLVNEMNSIKATIDNGVSGITTKAEGVYVRYTTSDAEFTIGNTGSIAVSLIEAAGGVNVGKTDTTDQRRYGDNSMMLQLLADHPNAVVFLDVTWKDAGYTVADYREKFLGGDTTRTVVQLESEWNNYGPDAKEGLKVVAQSLYPSVFGENSFDEGEPTGDNNLVLYVGAACVGIIVLAGVYFVLMRR